MFKFNNTHIFTGYLKQKLSSVNIPTCKIYTRENEEYLEMHGEEDPRIIESTDTVVYKEDNKQLAVRVNYLKGNEIYNYYNDHNLGLSTKKGWQRANLLFYNGVKKVPGLTKTLNSPGNLYDKVTHEYLGDYLRFLRDYHDINLMSLYNCFNNTLCNNLNFTFPYKNKKVEFSSYDNNYRIYVFPVKLFANYTIAVDSYHGIEIFCGLYNTHLYNPNSSDKIRKDRLLGTKTYLKKGKISFNQPFLFDKLSAKNWSYENELKTVSGPEGTETQLDATALSRWDIINREQDLKMFIKVPTSCRSSIVVLEGDYVNYNNAKYTLNPGKNLRMTGCSEGSDVKVLSTQPTPVKDDYKLSTWQFGYTVAQPLSEEDVDAKINMFVPSLYCVNPPAIEDVWVQDTFSQPNYSADFDGCEIHTGAELAYIIKNNGKTVITDDKGQARTISNYKLMNDIYLNDPSKINWETGTLLDSNNSDYEIRNWFSVTENDKKEGFSGIIDGNGHVIFGLFIKNDYTGKNYAGLIPVIDVDKSTTIKNLGLNNAYIQGSYAQAFIGGTTDSKVSYDRWKYEQNHSIVNFYCNNNHSAEHLPDTNCDKAFANSKAGFKPISKLQLLEFNTGESYPFADRLIEYLCGSAITPIDEIPDNIKRAQRVMKQNQHYFRIEGLWENKMQKIIYDYLMNSGPIEQEGNRLVDKRRGYHNKLGHTSKSTLYDILGYVDKDAEKWYASTVKEKNTSKIKQETIQNVDIYDGLYNI